ncbi:MAG: deoxyribose-phosphate aldolase, partial [Bacteroidaceae bacterium]|nr:deoxyribose-phosphate aldolase [Bacteroidaceae bacterium]
MTEHHHHDENCCCGGGKIEQAFAKYNLCLNDEEVHAAVTRLLEQKKAQYDTAEVRRELLSTVELTTLKVTDSQESVLQFTERVNRFADEHPDLPHLATVCVYPNFAKIVSESLEAEGVEVACVSGGFPSAQTFIEIKTTETALAVHDGATEIDMVLSVGTFLSGDYETCADEIAEIKAACSERPLKVILLEKFIP